MKKILGSIAISMVIPALYWLGGWEWVRGEGMFYLGLFTLAVFVAAITCPYWDSK